MHNASILFSIRFRDTPRSIISRVNSTEPDNGDKRVSVPMIHGARCPATRFKKILLPWSSRRAGPITPMNPLTSARRKIVADNSVWTYLSSHFYSLLVALRTQFPRKNSYSGVQFPFNPLHSTPVSLEPSTPDSDSRVCCVCCVCDGFIRLYVNSLGTYL